MAPGLLAGRAILVVEDEPLLAMLLGEELQAAGAQQHPADDAQIEHMIINQQTT